MICAIQFLCNILEFEDSEIFERRVPFAHMTIDKTLYPYHGRIGFKQSKPSKRIKYGFLCRSLGDSSVQSTYLSLPYAGKP